ncbi:L-alanine exporter AlaE, partial [Pectobacterium brasiliense]
DTIALVVYCLITGMAIDIMLSCMSIDLSLSSRLLSIPVYLAIAWPYVLYRDSVLNIARRLGVEQFLVRSVADLF